MITPAQLRLLRWYAEGRIDYPPRGKVEPLQRAGYLTPGWDRTVTSAGLALLASTPELDREVTTKKTVLIAFGQNVPSHPQIPKGSRWRNKRSKRESVVQFSSETHVLYEIGDRTRTMTAVQWLAGSERIA